MAVERLAAALDLDGDDALGLAACVALCEACGVAPGVLTRDAFEEWYPALEKPDRTPPGPVFGPVWTFLYLAMGVAAYLVWRDARDTPRGRVAVGAFVLQLGFNVAWTFVFFGGRSILGGLVLVVGLALSLAWTVLAFALVKPKAALLLLPYLAWVGFASLLNRDLYLLNR